MKISSKIVETTVNEARKSEYIHHLGAVIFNKNRIISKSYNKVVFGHTPKHIDARINKHDNVLSIHAEMAALIKADYKDLRGASICVIRINKRGEFRLARPCSNCMKHLIASGIKNVVYSINAYPYLQIERIG